MSSQGPQHDVSDRRKFIYYGGGLLMLTGFLSFGSVFVSAALNFGNFDDFDAQVRSMALRAVVGMGLMIFGVVVAHIGRAGAAGSGIVLDPRRARQDLEPFNRAAGGMADDALSEIGLVKKLGDALDGRGTGSEPAPLVKVRCRTCSALNDEHAAFCNGCGGAL